MALSATPTPGDSASVDAARLPFDGTIAVRHRAKAAVGDLEALGCRIFRCWGRGEVFEEPLLSGRGVLMVAASMSECALTAAVTLIGSHLAELHDLREQTMARLLAEVGRFISQLESQGVGSVSQVTEQNCTGFIEQAVTTRAGGWDEPSISTRYLRRTAIRLFFGTARQLHLAAGDPTIDIRLPPRSSRTTRPLGDDEEALGRVWAQPTLASTRHPTAWAIGQATGTGSELAAATVDDLDLPGQRIWLSGNERWREARWGQLTDWGVQQVIRRLAVIGTDPTTPLVSGATASRNARQASASNAIGDVITAAGLRTDAGVRPGSLPAWSGRRVYDATGRIEDAATALGVRSLDRTAEIIGLERW